MGVKSISKIYSAELEGINARLIEIEVDINVGLHSFTIVGLADKALNEARERVNSALKNSGKNPPNRENRRITINLAPADVKKNGSQYDLAIALGYLGATKQTRPFDAAGKIFIGELALDGTLRPVRGALNIAQLAEELGYTDIFLPRQNAQEASAVRAVRVVPLGNLREAIAVTEGEQPAPTVVPASSEASRLDYEQTGLAYPDFSEIVGQRNAKRALLVAAGGAHNLLFKGPPGVGKSMLARALARILPPLSIAEAIEITKVWSAAGLSPGGLLSLRPFRAPHQTASISALIGGGRDPRPGEISLAHRGILFLDEFPEFPRNILEALREPLESGEMRVARAKESIVFPAKFTLVAAMNPCPCGYYGDPERQCDCSAYEVIKYQKKISGPLLDRIDIQINVGRMKVEELRSGRALISESAPLREKVKNARKIQRERYERACAENTTHDISGRHALTNSEATSSEIQREISLDASAEKFLSTLGRSRISPRGYYRTLKVARTIADLDATEHVTAEHLAEAFSYRLREGE